MRCHAWLVTSREVAAFEAVLAYANNKRGGPLGEGEVIILSLDGLRYRFRMESLFNGHEALTLGVYLGPVLTQVPIA